MPEISPAVLQLSTYRPAETTPLMKMRAAYFQAVPEVCVERPRWLTMYHAQNGLFNQDKISILDKARAYRYVLGKRTPIVRHTQFHDSSMKCVKLDDRSPFAGSTTSKFKGVPLYPELIGLTLWPELRTLKTRDQNPYFISSTDIEELNFTIFPAWMKKNILELGRSRLYEQNLRDYGVRKSAPEIQLMQQIVFYLCSKPVCISHTIPDFSKALKAGLSGMLEEARNHLNESPPGGDKAMFYEAQTEVLNGLLTYAGKLSNVAARLAERATDPAERDELNAIAAIYARVPAQPARTFREGLTTVWLVWTACHLENANVGLSLGRLDQVLYDLYRADIDAGALTPEEATDLVGHLWLKIGDHVPMMIDTGEKLFGGTGSNQAITVGGVDSNGADAVNDLTYVILRATELMMLRDPNLNARYHPEQNSDEYLKRLCDVNLHTKATPAIHNDQAVINALTERGDSIEHARDFGIVGCVEPASAGRTYGHHAAILLNLPAALELALYNGKHRRTGIGPDGPQIGPQTGDPRSLSSFAEFKDAVKTQLVWLIEQATRLNDLFGECHQDFYPTPILSTFFEGPSDKGKDLIEGGAVINASGLTLIGLADTADCLSAIEKHIFQAGTVTFDRMLKALDTNFFGHQDLYTQLKNPERTPKFGNDDDIADGNALTLLEDINNAVAGITTYRGGTYRVGCWTMTIHAGLARLTGALPNGRLKNENFASGVTPVSNVTPELTPALNSVAKIPSEFLSSGIALNLKFTPHDGSDNDMIDRLAAMVKGCFDTAGGTRDGCIEVQFNITDHDTFRKAMDKPEDFPELLVRVSGYTAYFKDLNRQMQEEILERTEYLLSTGRMQVFEDVPLYE